MTAKKQLTLLEGETNAFRSGGGILLSFPAIVSSFAYFAPKTHGAVIGLLFLLPLVFYVPIWLKLRDPAQFRPSLPAGLLLAVTILTGLAFVSLTIAYLPPSETPFWRLFSLQLILIFAGLLAGLIKHDAKALQKNQRARHKISPGHVLIRRRPGGIYGYRQSTGSLLFDWGARVVYGAYAIVVMIGAFLGGAAPVVLLKLIGPWSGMELDRHMTGMTLLGLLVLPFIGYVLPALYRTWIGLRTIERTAGHPRTQVVYSWEP